MDFLVRRQAADVKGLKPGDMVSLDTKGLEELIGRMRQELLGEAIVEYDSKVQILKILLDMQTTTKRKGKVKSEVVKVVNERLNTMGIMDGLKRSEERRV